MDEFDKLIDSQSPSEGIQGFADELKRLSKSQEDFRNTIRKQKMITDFNTDPYGLDWNKVDKKTLLNSAEKTQGLDNPFENESELNRIKDASNNSLNEQKILNENGEYEDFNPTDWSRSELSFLGYNDFLYEKPIEGTANIWREALKGSGKVLGSDDYEGALYHVLEKFDKSQQYDFLVPTVDPKTGKNILRRVSGTYEDVVKKGYNTLNQYGLESGEDGLIESSLKAFINTASETDDIVVGAAKYAQDAALYLSGNSDVNTSLDEVWDDINKDTKRKNFLLSEESAEFGSLDWFGSGVGSAMSSLMQFGGIGRGVRGAGSAIEGISKAFGSKAAKGAIANKVASYGSSGIIGFGYGYNEALQNGLPEGSALLYGTLVGGLNSLIETQLGQDFDKFLTGGGPKLIASDILRNIEGDVTETGMRNFLRDKAGDYIAGMSDRFRNIVSEGSEEVLQDVVEQSSKLTYNALFAEGKVAGEDKFNIREYDFSQTVAAGIFGAVAAAPFNTTKRNIAHHIANGQEKDVDIAIENLLTTGKIDQNQYNSLKSEKEELASIFNLNKNLFDGFVGEYKDKITEEAMSLLSKKTGLEKEKDKLIQGLQNNPDQSATTQAKVEEINRVILETSKNISKYGDPEFLKERATNIKKNIEILQENRNNIFGQIASNTNFETDKTEKDTVNRVGTLTGDFFAKNPIARTPEEAVNVLNNINRFDVSIPPVFAKQLLSMKLYLSPTVNTMENRDTLLELGISEDLLPLTPEETEDSIANPEKYVNRIITENQLGAIMSTVDPKIESKIGYVIANRDKFGITEAQLHSLDNKANLSNYLTPEQVKAINTIYDKSMPTSIFLSGSDNKNIRGIYDSQTNFLNVSGDLSYYNALDKSSEEYKKFQDNLFHVLTHETGHAIFDRDLKALHLAWVKSLNPNAKLTQRDNASAAYFARLLSLARVSYEALKNKSGAKNLYFFKDIAPNFLSEENKKPQETALIFVREFFAESFSNTKQQLLMDSFDINDEKNKIILDKYSYSYSTPEVNKRETLLSQAIKAVSGIFQSLRGILTRTERNLLTEAFHLGSNIDFNKYYSTQFDTESRISLAEMSVSAYNGVNIFEGEQIDHQQFIANLYKRLEKAGVRLNKAQQEDLLGRMLEFVRNNITNDTADEIVDGSMLVVYFKATDNFMVSWRTVGEENDNIHRAFFNKYGVKINMNTNTENYDSGTRLAKPNIFDAFDLTRMGTQNQLDRKILNNFEKAGKEDFVGSAELVYDPTHTWRLDGNDLNGQVNVVYTFTDGSKDVIGYAPDLTKIRLANLLSNGSKIFVRIQKLDSNGSSAYVKRDSDGNLIEVYRTNDKSIDPRQYTREQVSPGVDFLFLPSIVSQEAIRLADSIDTITSDNSQLQPQVKPEELLTGSDILRANYSQKEWFTDFSFYNNDDEIQASPELEFFRKGLSRFIRRSMFFNTNKGQEVVIDQLYQMASDYNLRATDEIKQKHPGISNPERLGFDSDEEFLAFAEEAINDATQEFRKSGNINSEDWSGVGGNPSGRISVGIKADLEALSVTYNNQKRWIDFSDAKNILFEVSKNTANYDQMVASLKSSLDAKIYGGLKKLVAEAIYNHLSKDRSAATPDNVVFNSIKNSYWSQFGSYIRLDAITFAPQENSSFVYFNGEKSYLNKRSQDYALAIESKINEILDSIPSGSVKEKMDVIKNRMADFFIQRYSNKLILAGMNEQEAINQAEEILSTQTGNRSNPINKLISFRNLNNERQYNLKGFSASGIMAPFSERFYTTFGIKSRNNGSAYGSYKNHIQLLDSYFAFFGIEIPEIVTDLKQNIKNLKSLLDAQNDLVSKGYPIERAQDQIQKAMELTSVNDYFMVAFKPRKEKEVKEYPFMIFATDLVDNLNYQMDQQLKGNKYDYKIGEMDVLSKTLMQLEGTYRSPEFYFNAEFEKEWSMKIRSYSDSLVEELSDDSGLLDEYLSKDLFKNNKFLRTIKNAKGNAIQFMISGIKSVDQENDNKSFANANDLDYLYMNLSGFVHNYGSDTYYHIDDVPSDKPKNMAYRMSRIDSKALKSEVDSIINHEKERTAIQMERIFGALSPAGKINGTRVFEIIDQKSFDELIPNVHYGKAITKEDGSTVYTEGWIANSAAFFYGGKSANEVIKEIESESQTSYNDFVSQGMNFPVNTQFIKELNEKQLSEDEKSLQLRAEQERIFKEWRSNYIINRYHLNQVLMGDYMYYKQDNFSDLNKRHAGTVAPSSKGVFNRPTLKAVILRDADIETTNGEYELPRVELNESGEWIVSEDKTLNLTGNINRTDAQGYVTERFANEMQDAYGAFSGYEKTFKPVVYGISKKNIEFAQPIYMKLSLAILPDPFNVDNDDYYTKYPSQRSIAEKFYNSGADFATFNSGVKVGINQLSNINDESYKIFEFDSNLFGLQNNPYHDPNSEDNYLSGMVQQTKQLGDNNNFNIMSIYHDIEGKLVDNEVQSYLDNKLNSLEQINQNVKESLEKNEFSAPIADFINDGVQILDNPITAKFAENMVNAGFKNAIQLYPKDGEKLVNVSDYGFSRPTITTEEIDQRNELLDAMNIPRSKYNQELLWAGPRTPNDLTIFQLIELKRDIENGVLFISDDFYIIDRSNNIKIYPAEALVPEGPNYSVGDRMISTRIPTSKKSSSIPSVVVGFTHASQGNIVVFGKAGTAILGYDFDVDGLFVWRERQRQSNHPVRKMFNTAFSILTNPKNYTELTSPTVTDNIAQLANEIDALTEQGGNKVAKYSKFSPERQLQLKKLNSIGKVMIGVSAAQYGIHSVLQQNDGSSFVSTENDARSYRFNERNLKEFVDHHIDENGINVQVTDVFSEFINAAADNAKLQYLGRINANPITGSVLFDMISHGFSLRYTLYFVNQPVIKEYVKLTENQQSASYKGDKRDVSTILFERIENQIRSLGSEFQSYRFNGRDSKGNTVLESKAINHYLIQDGKVKLQKYDAFDLSIESLREGISNDGTLYIGDNVIESQFVKLENQLVVLDKFNYYKTLANISSNAGKLVTLTSTYPKTYIELIDRKSKIDSALKDKDVKTQTGDVITIPAPIEISSLVLTHGMYKVHYRRMEDLINQYQKFKLYANPIVNQIHEDVAKNRSVSVQQKVHDDFYTYVLSQENESDNENFIYNLSTSSLNGTIIDPYFFVEYSARLIDEIKRKFPENNFLRILKTNINKNFNQVMDKAIKPSQVSIALETDPDGELLSKIRSAFMALPTDYSFRYNQIIDGSNQIIDVTVPSVQDIVLGHLLYTQGFALGGFSFSKLLPTETAKFFDNSIDTVKSRLASYEELNPINDQESTDPDLFLPSIKSDVISDRNYSALKDAGLLDFINQVKMNIPELITNITQDQLMPAIQSENGHYAQWNPDTINDFDIYNSAMAVKVKADGGEVVNIQVKSNNAENIKLVKSMSQKGLIKMKDLKGQLRTYKVSPIQETTNGKYKVKYIELETINFINYPNLKQYGSLFTNVKSNSEIESTDYNITSEDTTIEPMIEEIPVVRNNFQVINTVIDAQRVREGSQTGALLETEDNLKLGQRISIPTESGSVIVEVKKLWPINMSYERALATDPENASTRLLNWASRLTGQNQTSVFDLADKIMVEFEYVATISDTNNINGSVDPIYSDPNENGDISVNNISDISYYEPRESNKIYKSIMFQAGETLKAIPNTPFDINEYERFFKYLQQWDLDVIQIQMISDYIANQALTISSLDDISNGLLAIATSPDTLENYNTTAAFDRYTESPLEKLHEIATVILGPRFYELSDNFAALANTPVHEELVNPDTLLPYTYYEWLVLHFDKYTKEERRFKEIRDKIDEKGLENFSYEELLKDYSEIRQQMGSIQGLIWKKNVMFIERLGAKIGSMSEGKSFDVISMKTEGFTGSFGQQDIKTWEQDLTSITDFTEKQAAMQDVGRHVSVGALKADAEKLKTNSVMQSLMREVMVHHYAGQPKSFVDKINIFKWSDQIRNVFDWMLERDVNGEYSGRMIARYKETEKQWKDKIYEQETFVNPDNTIGRKFKISNNKVLSFLKANNSGLTDTEKNRMLDIAVRYNNYDNFHELWENFTESEKAQSGKDTSFIRNLWVKVKVKSQDSTYFEDLKREAANNPLSSIGKLASAKIRLYDFLYDKSNELLVDTGYYNSPIERGFMPMTGADFSETWSRYGFKQAKELFLKDTKDDIDLLETQTGLVVGYSPIIDFETSKKVPYRTIRKKQNFSVSVPTIFSHHFNTLIFKKHYDPILPIMDAVQMHYKMKKKLYGEDFDNTVAYLTEWANQKIFYKQKDFAKTKWAKALKLSSSLVVTQFLGLAPVSSFVNWSVGSLETYKHLIGDYGFKDGNGKFAKGMSRIFNIKGESVNMTRLSNGQFLLNPKALEIMNHYGLETFTNSEILKLDNVAGRIQDVMLVLQKNSEMMIRGAAFFAEMNDEQWDSFTLTSDGVLNVGPNAPSELTVAEWKNRIGSVQGKYDEETKRLYHGNTIYQAAFLFKGWLVDYVRSRVSGGYYDQFGFQREGYYRTAGRLLVGSRTTATGEKEYNVMRFLESLRGKETLTPLEEQNLRKVYFDLALKIMLVLLPGAFDDNDKEENWYRNYLGKISSQMFLLTNPNDIVKMVKSPFAGLHNLEQGAKLLDGLLELNGEQMMKAGYSMTPGRQLIETIGDIVEETEE